MSPAQRQRLKEALESLAQELSARAPVQIEPNRTDEARAGGDEDSQPLNEMEQAIASSRNRIAAATLLRVEKALRKLRENPDDFGLCEDCEEDLPPKRLEAMPYAELCVPCQGKRDSLRSGHTRKSLTDFS